MKHRDASTEKTQRRFADNGDTVLDFMVGGILVECPSCGGCAEHRPIGSAESRRGMFAPRRLVCTECGLVRDWAERTIHRRWRGSPARDDYFGAILWLRERFGDEEVWAYNWEHLAFLERYVAAALRSRMRHSETGWSNRSFVSRLPIFIKLAKNRARVLAAIRRIRRKRAP